MIITLLGKPMSNNSIYKTMCRGNFPTRYLSSKGKALKEDYMWQVKSQYHGEPLKGYLKASIMTFHDNHRKNDWDNFHKLSMDALTGLVYEDDSQILQVSVIKTYDKKNPRIVIYLEETTKIPYKSISSLK